MLLNHKENRGTREPVGKEKQQRHKRCHAASARPETKASPPLPPPRPVAKGLAARVKGQVKGRKPEAELAAPRPDRFSFGEFAEEQEAMARNKAEAAVRKAAAAVAATVPVVAVTVPVAAAPSGGVPEAELEAATNRAFDEGVDTTLEAMASMLSKLQVPTLQQALSDLSLPTSGSKGELSERLTGALSGA